MQEYDSLATLPTHRAEARDGHHGVHDGISDIEAAQVAVAMQMAQAKPPALAKQAQAAAVSALSEEALLALVLRTPSKRGGDATSQARRLLQGFGNLRAIAAAGHAELASTAGISIDKAAALLAGIELGHRHVAAPLSRGQTFTSSHQVYQVYAAQLCHLEQETFWVLLMDQRNRVLRQLEIAKGSINRCPVMPQDVFSQAIREKAVRMVLLHNHPSGDPEPSADDRSLTRRLVHIAELMCIEIIDHIVLGDQRYVSFADRGWL